jgi:predicted outer membrane repeat protein
MQEKVLKDIFTMKVINTLFIGNRAYSRYRSTGGGAISTMGLNATVIQCQFIRNSAVEKGGGLYNTLGCSLTTSTPPLLTITTPVRKSLI